MNNDSSSCEFGNAGKRSREEEEEEEDRTASIDRLSHLPECIIYHILSFLDTKSAVQTSVLSRVWQSAWKHVPVITFRSDSFQQYSSFQRFVDNLLSLRGPYNVTKMSYIDSENDGELDFGLFDKVIEYAFSHDTQHLVIDLDDWDAMTEDSYSFSDLFGTISNCNLKTLELRSVHIDRGFGSYGFAMMTTLVLKDCLLRSDREEDFDPFSNFPSLKNLVVSHCLYFNYVLLGPKKILKISGPQLHSLELEELLCSKMEIIAPRLKFFTILHHLDSLVFSNLSLPSLDHADIRVNDEEKFMVRNKEQAAQNFISLFQGLNNALSLTINWYFIEVLSNISEVLEQQSSPFTRMKTLIMYADSVPYALANYFLKGSSSTKPNVEFR